MDILKVLSSLQKRGLDYKTAMLVSVDIASGIDSDIYHALSPDEIERLLDDRLQADGVLLSADDVGDPVLREKVARIRATIRAATSNVGAVYRKEG